MYEKFTKKYKLSKTLRFGLIPQGKTLENIEKNGILEEDELRAKEAVKVKALADEYHKAFIDRILSALALKGIDKYVVAYEAQKEGRDNAAEILSEYAKELREEISSSFAKDKDFAALFTGKMYSDILPAYFAGDDEALASLSMFDKFTTYFRGFNDNKKLMYEASDAKGGPKHGTIAARVVNDNLPIFIENEKKIRRVADAASDIVKAIEDTLYLLLGGKGLAEAFSTDSYSDYLSQKGIDAYNQIIGGYSKEDGSKIKGLNEYINEYNQKAESREDRLAYIIPLKKQILSDRSTISFVPDKFETDKEVEEALLKFDAVTKAGIDAIAKQIENIGNFDEEGIFIKTDALKEISNKVFDSWHYISDLLIKKYDEESEVPEGKRATKAYQDKRRKALESRKSYSLLELDLIPGIDGKIGRYIAGAASFHRASIEFARKDLVKRIQKRESIERSLRRDDFAKADIKTYLDAVLDFRNFAAMLDTDDAAKDFDFYAPMEEHMEELSATRGLYNKTRNYLSGKLYSNENIKLNFRSAEFLGGWAESIEKTKLGTIFLKDGKYYLGIIAKGAGDLFANMPNAKTDDVYMKMRYNQISVPARDIPKVAFSKKGIEALKPDADVLRAYSNKTFISGKDFSLDDCHKVIDYYKRCLGEYPTWRLYGLHLKDTSEYAGINEFYNDVALDAYDVKFRAIDADVIESLVSEGRLYLFEIWHKDFSEHAHGKPDLSTMYFRALFDEQNLETGQYRLNGGAEMFYRKASIKDADIIRHKAGERVKAKTESAQNKKRTFSYDIIKDKRFTMDHFQLNVPITINAKSPDFCLMNTEAKLAIKNADNPHVIGVSRGENCLVHITVLDGNGNTVESRSLNAIGGTDYFELLSKREAERDAARKSWESVEGIKQLKDGYLSLVIREIADLMIKYDAIVAIEDISQDHKRGRQKIERAVYQQLEGKLISKLNFLVNKDADPNEPGGIYEAYQLTSPFDSFEKIGRQTGFIFYVSPWKTTAIDSETGFVNLFDTRYTSVANAKAFWEKFDSITYDETEKCYRFDFDYHNFVFDKRKDLLDGTRTDWSVYLKGERLMPVKTDKGIRHEKIELSEQVDALFDKMDIGSDEDLRAEISGVAAKEFHENLLKIFGLAVSMRNGSDICSLVKTGAGGFFSGASDANGSYNIARKGLIILDRIRSSSEEQLIAKGKDGISVNVTANEYLRGVQK